MSKKWFLSIGILLIVLNILVQSVHAEEPPTVIINELMWSGSSISANDEWIELYNNTDEDIDLSGWQITKNTGTEGLMFEMPAGLTIVAGEYFLISNYELGVDSILNVVPDLVDGSVTLSNSKLEIKLYDGQFDDGREPIDIAGDGNQPLAGNNIEKHSMERNSLISDGSLTNSWHSSSEQINLINGATELATPKSENSETIINNPPDAAAGTDIETNVGEEIILNASESSDPENDSLTFSWDLDDSDGISEDAVGEEVTYTYHQTGEYTVTLTVSDGELTDTDTLVINVAPTVYTDKIVITEILPRPSAGSDHEFIELKNIGNEKIDLGGWQLDDVKNGGSSPYTIPDGMEIAAGGYLVFYKSETHLALNDGGDQARLLNPNGDEVSKTDTYENAKKDESWNLNNNEEWVWSIKPTPGEINQIVQSNDNNEEEEEDNNFASTSQNETTDTNYSKKIIVNELLPNPNDEFDEEFIELKNTGNVTVNLEGWKLQDQSGRTFQIENTILGPNQFIVFENSESKIFLNNKNGESLMLIWPNNQVAQTVTYTADAKSGFSYAYDSDSNEFIWTAQPTPNLENIFRDSQSDYTLVETGNRIWLATLLALLSTFAIKKYLPRHSGPDDQKIGKPTAERVGSRIRR